MPYSADLRCSYARTEINKCWILHFIEEDMGLDITFEDESAEVMFFRNLENDINDFIRDKVFWGAAEGKSKKFDGYNTVWEYLASVFEDPQVLEVLGYQGVTLKKEEEAQSYICHKCCRSDIQTEAEREKYDPLCQKCYEEDDKPCEIDGCSKKARVQIQPKEFMGRQWKYMGGKETLWVCDACWEREQCQSELVK